MTLRKPTYKEAQVVTRRPSNCIGSGTYRSVYHEPGSPWVFKRDVGGKYNRDEYAAYLRYRENRGNLPRDIRIPETHLLENPRNPDLPILAMRYIPGEEGPGYCDAIELECWCEPEDVERRGGCWSAKFTPYTDDAHHENVREYRGILWLIDAQDFMNEEYLW